MYREEIIQINNKTYQYIDTKIGKKTIFILHGMAGNKEAMTYFTHELWENFRCIYIDLPGHNNISCENFNNSKDFALYITEFINFMKLENYGILGFSFGGGIAVETGKLVGNKIPICTWAANITGKTQLLPKILVNVGLVVPKVIWESPYLNKIINITGINFSKEDFICFKKTDKRIFKKGIRLLEEKIDIPKGMILMAIMDPKDIFVKPTSQNKDLNLHLVEYGGHFGKRESVEESLKKIEDFFNKAITL